MVFIFVLAKNVLLCHFILFVFPPQKCCNYCTSETVDSIIENGRAIYQKCYSSKIFFISDFLKKLDAGCWPCKSYLIEQDVREIYLVMWFPVNNSLKLSFRIIRKAAQAF